MPTLRASSASSNSIPPGPVRAEQHPEREEGDEHGETGPRRAKGDDDARRQDRAHEQEHRPFVHISIFPGGRRARRVEHFRDGNAATHAQDRPALRDRPGRGQARLRVLLRAPQADRPAAVDEPRRPGALGRGRFRARPPSAGDARRARSDVRQVRPAPLDQAGRRPAGHRGRVARPAGRRAAVPVRPGARGAWSPSSG